MLREYVETTLTPQEIGDRLTMAGFELEDLLEVDGEPVFDVNVMSNRGDAASVLGMARELIAKDVASKPTGLFHRATQRFPRPDDGEPLTASDGIRSEERVRIETEQCTRYACRLFEGLVNGPSPEWLQRVLRQVGQRPISLLVDLTNYVMLETGQPLHAFDLDKLAGRRIVVRQARQGEKLVTLDGQVRELNPDQMMICDAKKPVAAAGIMGGLETEVDQSTTRCLLESAHFDPSSVRRTRKQLGLHTEASYRFERWVDPDGVVAALNRFAELLEQIAGVNGVPGVADVYRVRPVREPIRLRTNRLARILGYPVPLQEAQGCLDRLGFAVEPQEGSLVAVAPTWRNDIHREDDLVEEVGRVLGYERIPECLPQGTTTEGGAHGFEAMVDRAKEAMLACGFVQTMSHSLRPEHPLDSPGERVCLRNPASPETAWLRSSLLPCLAENAQRNGGKDLHLFEIGRCFQPEDRVLLAGLSVGLLYPEHWKGSPQARADFFSLKGAVEYLFRVLRADLDLQPSSSDPRIHPGRQAALLSDGKPVGVLGQIHPDIADEAGLNPDTVLFEVDLPSVWEAGSQEIPLRSLSRNPGVRRDIAVLLDKLVPYSAVSAAVEKAGGEVLERHWLFDVYEGSGIPEGSHSLAIALQLRKMGANLTDEEANRVRDGVVQALERLGWTQR